MPKCIPLARLACLAAVLAFADEKLKGVAFTGARNVFAPDRVSVPIRSSRGAQEPRRVAAGDHSADRDRRERVVDLDVHVLGGRGGVPGPATARTDEAARRVKLYAGEQVGERARESGEQVFRD